MEKQLKQLGKKVPASAPFGQHDEQVPEVKNWQLLTREPDENSHSFIHDIPIQLAHMRFKLP